MVESQIVILAVAGSNPVGHPISLFPRSQQPRKGCLFIFTGNLEERHTRLDKAKWQI